MLIIILIFLGILIITTLLIIILYKSNKKYDYYDNKIVKYIYLINKKIFTLKNKDKDNKYFLYNSSIQWKNNDKNTILNVARVSELYDYLLNTCLTYKEMKQNVIINNQKKYFDIYKDYKHQKSGIVKFDIILSDNKDKIINADITNPFFSEKNIDKNHPSVGFQDPRLFIFKNKIWIICFFRGVKFPFKSITNTENYGNHLFIYPIDMSVNPVILYYKNQKKLEKNWMPFEYNKELYIIYNINPNHEILKVDINTGNCEKIYETKTKIKFEEEYGNGAPPQLIKIFNKEYYIGIVHNRGTFENNITRKNRLYLFETQPPFEIKYFSDIFNLDKKFYRIEFCTGLLVNQDKGIVYLSYGVNDCYNILTSIEIKDIEKILKKI